jgi:hypothetical protein
MVNYVSLAVVITYLLPSNRGIGRSLNPILVTGS